MEDFEKMEGLEDLSIADQASEMHRVLRDEKEDRDYERWLYMEDLEDLSRNKNGEDYGQKRSVQNIRINRCDADRSIADL